MSDTAWHDLFSNLPLIITALFGGIVLLWKEIKGTKAIQESKDAIDEMAKIEIYQTTFVQRFLLLARAVLPFVGRHTTTTAVQPTKEAKLPVKHVESLERRVPINRIK